MASELDRALAQARRNLDTVQDPTAATLLRLYGATIDRLESQLVAVTGTIRDAQANGTTINPDWLRRQSAYRRMLDQLAYDFQLFATNSDRVMTAAQRESARAAFVDARTIAQAAGVTFGANVNFRAAERLAGALSPGVASPVRRVVDGYGPYVADLIERELMAGLGSGQGPRETERRILRTLNGAGPRARIEALVRTESMRAYRGTLFDQYKQLSGVDQWRWCAAKQTRTCLACLAMDGKVFPMSQDFMKPHVRCRCIPTPVVDGVDYQSGESWLARQKPDTLRKMFGADDVYEAYKSGELSLDDFVGIRRDNVWGESVYRKGNGVVMRAADIPRAA